MGAGRSEVHFEAGKGAEMLLNIHIPSIWMFYP